MIDADDLVIKKRQFIKFLRGKSVLVTSQRLAIFEAALRTDSPFNAEQIFNRARQAQARLSRSAVYRTLRLLSDGGFLGVLGSRKDFNYYDSNDAQQTERTYILCIDCGKIFNCPVTRTHELETKMTRKKGFTIQSTQTEIRGRCNDLKKYGSCKKRNADQQTI